MQHLHLVGFTAELDGLIFSTRRGSKSGGYVVSLDDRLLDSIREAVRLQTGAELDLEPEEGAPAPVAIAAVPELRRLGRVHSALSPKDIQARLRAGRSVAEVADEAEVDESWILRFASPVLAEQSRIVERALQLPCRANRKGESAEPLDVSVTENLIERGTFLTPDEISSAWSAYHVRDSAWVVRFRYVSRRRQQVAQWAFDLADSTLVPINRLATELGYLEPGRRKRRLVPPEVVDDRRQLGSDDVATMAPTSARPAAKRRAAVGKSRAGKTTATRRPAKAAAGRRPATRTAARAATAASKRAATGASKRAVTGASKRAAGASKRTATVASKRAVTGASKRAAGASKRTATGASKRTAKRAAPGRRAATTASTATTAAKTTKATKATKAVKATKATKATKAVKATKAAKATTATKAAAKRTATKPAKARAVGRAATGRPPARKAPARVAPAPRKRAATPTKRTGTGTATKQAATGMKRAAAATKRAGTAGRVTAATPTPLLVTDRPMEPETTPVPNGAGPANAVPSGAIPSGGIPIGAVPETMGPAPLDDMASPNGPTAVASTPPAPVPASPTTGAEPAAPPAELPTPPGDQIGGPVTAPFAGSDGAVRARRAPVADIGGDPSAAERRRQRPLVAIRATQPPVPLAERVVRIPSGATPGPDGSPESTGSVVIQATPAGEGMAPPTLEP